MNLKKYKSLHKNSKMCYNFGVLTSKKGYEMIKIRNRKFGYNRAGGGGFAFKNFISTILKYFCLWIIFSANLVWANQVFDCTTETCGTSKGESKFFALPTYFHNVDINNFANNGAMTFKNPVYFSANDKDFEIDTMATFTNNGLMTFESNATFQRLMNVNDGILNFNADMGGDDLYAAVSGNIFNDGTINVNGQIGFSAAIGEEAYNWWQVIVNNESGTFNVNGKTKIEQVVHNVGSFYIYNDATFEQVLHNLNGGLFVIERPTIVTYWLNNQRRRNAPYKRHYTYDKYYK